MTLQLVPPEIPRPPGYDDDPIDEEVPAGISASDGSRPQAAMVAIASHPMARQRRVVRPATRDLEFRGQVMARNNCYVYQTRDTEIAISTFRMALREILRTPRGDVLVVDIHLANGQMIENVQLPRNAFVGKRSLIMALPTTEAQWTGTDDHVQGLLRLLHERDVPVRQGVDTLGYVETADGPRWVVADRVIGVRGDRDPETVVYVGTGSSLASRLHYRDVDDVVARRAAESILPLLPEMNHPSVTYPAIGWFFASVLKVRLMSRLRHFPILWIWGPPGGGKTRMLTSVFLPALGLPLTEPFSCSAPKFALVKLLASTTSIPVFLDEYRTVDLPQQRKMDLHRLLRQVYGGEIEERGRADLTTTSYVLSAPVCVAGEARPDDSALVDRLVSVMPSRSHLEQNPQCVEAFEQLQAVDLGALAVPYLRFALGRDFGADLGEAVTRTNAALTAMCANEKISARCRDNLTVLAFGARMYEEFAAVMSVHVPRLDLTVAFKSTLADLMDGDRGAKTALDHVVEALDHLAYSGKLVPDQDYAVVDDCVCIYLPSCWNAYLENMRRTGQSVESIDYKALRRQIFENHDRGGYVVNPSKTVGLGERRPRTVAIDLARAVGVLALDHFPTVGRRQHGGPRTPGGGQ